MTAQDTAGPGPRRGLGPLPKHDLVAPPEPLQRNWGWLLALGVLLILGGVAALVLPVVASIAVTATVAVVFLAGGAMQAVQLFRTEGWRARAWFGLSGVVYLAGGVLLLLNPLAGTVALAVVAAAVFLVDGIVRSVAAIRMRPEEGWGWMLAAGLTGTLFAAALLAFLPAISLQLLGILAAVSLTFEGWACVFLAIAARRAAREA